MLLFAVAGGCFGLLILTKPETSLAAWAAIFVGCVATAFLGRDDRRTLTRNIPAFLAAAAMPPLAFFAYFRMHMPTDDAWRAVAGAWTALATPIARNVFYLRSMGLDDAVGSAGRMLMIFAGFLVFIAAGLSALVERAPRYVETVSDRAASRASGNAGSRDRSGAGGLPFLVLSPSLLWAHWAPSASFSSSAAAIVTLQFGCCPCLCGPPFRSHYSPRSGSTAGSFTMASTLRCLRQRSPSSRFSL